MPLRWHNCARSAPHHCTARHRPRLLPPSPRPLPHTPRPNLQLLLDQCDDVIADGDFSTLRSVLSRIKGDPNDAKANLEAAVAWIDDAKTATKAQETGFAFIEFLEQMDYNGYYDSMPRQALTGSQVAQFAAFSAKALASAKTKLAAFLALMPEEQLEAARLQLQ